LVLSRCLSRPSQCRLHCTVLVERRLNGAHPCVGYVNCECPVRVLSQKTRRSSVNTVRRCLVRHLEAKPSIRAETILSGAFRNLCIVLPKCAALRHSTIGARQGHCVVFRASPQGCTCSRHAS